MFHFQLSIFYDFQLLLQQSHFYRKYYALFKSLDLSGIPERNHRVGRKGYSFHAMLRALIVKHFEQIKYIPRLLDFLDAHPVLAEMCGFVGGILPNESQFYRFLKETKNSTIEQLMYDINKKLIAKDVISTSHLIMDSKPIMAATRDNNFKNPGRNTTNKHKKPKRNPSATLSYYSCSKEHAGKREIMFFWGYRTHVIVSREGIPLVELTLPNNITDAEVAKKLIKKFKRIYGLKKNTIFIADAGYDIKDLYNFIIEELKCNAFIPINPRGTKTNHTYGPHGHPVCQAGIEMRSCGSWTKKKTRTRRAKFRCALKASSQCAKMYPLGCPINHDRFTQGQAYGCTTYIHTSDDPRATVPRDTNLYKKTYALRTEVERYFARLGDREAEQTTHYKIKSIKNQMTIAHLSMSLLAYAAAILLEAPDKIRCYRTFTHSPPLTG